MQLKTVEEIAADFQSKYRASVVDSYTSEQTAWLLKTLTQDRADIHAVLREEIANMKGVYSAKDAIDKALTLINNTLLPGDVSK